MVDKKVIEIVLKKILNLQPEEKFLILTDKIKKELAQEFYDFASTITSEAKIKTISVMKHNGEEPPVEIAQEMKNSDVSILLTEKSLSHTQARREAVKNGARMISCPGLDKDILERCVDIDYEELGKFHDWLRSIIVGSQEIKVTSSAGTDITFSISNTHGKSSQLLKDKPGKSGNLPVGEVDSRVLNANGKIVIDGSIASIGLLKEPIVWEVKNNIAKIISDNDDSKKLKKLLDSVGPKAYRMAEFGIGTNPKAIITGEILEDEKSRGTVHFAVGNDLTYGGENDVPIHLDGVLRKPTMIVDGKKIIEDGEYL